MNCKLLIIKDSIGWQYRNVLIIIYTPAYIMTSIWAPWEQCSSTSSIDWPEKQNTRIQNIHYKKLKSALISVTVRWNITVHTSIIHQLTRREHVKTVKYTQCWHNACREISKLPLEMRVHVLHYYGHKYGVNILIIMITVTNKNIK